uniref:Adenylate cyclase-associated CAP C-terminal domain-containing protein n=1 Tax=viral metagenome TaxID=1070528 RepID=A0A6C0J3R6_9ZZZZ
MNNNTIIINSIENNLFNFKNVLNKKNTIIWKNCDNLQIIIKTKINKLVFYKCTNITLKFNEAVIGFEFDNCTNINVKLIKNKRINSLELFKSIININNLNKNTFLLLEKSKINMS